MAERVGELSQSSDGSSASYDVLSSWSITSFNRLLRKRMSKALHTSIRFIYVFQRLAIHAFTLNG